MLLAVCAIFAVLGVSCGQNVVSSVAFTAAFDSDRVLNNGETLVLNKVLINHGSGYNNNTGIFTAPKGGIYVFQLNALTAKSTSLWLKLYHNDNYVISVFARQTADYDTAGNSAILRLKKNDKVYSKVIGKASFFGRSDDIYTTFNGHLIGLLRDGDE